jgi:hypothetical protein
LAWAKAHREQMGCWPSVGSGPVANVPGEEWCALNGALRYGWRGLPGGSSLAQLLRQQCGESASGRAGNFGRPSERLRRGG